MSYPFGLPIRKVMGLRCTSQSTVVAVDFPDDGPMTAVASAAVARSRDIPTCGRVTELPPAVVTHVSFWQRRHLLNPVFWLRTCSESPETCGPYIEAYARRCISKFFLFNYGERQVCALMTGSVWGLGGGWALVRRSSAVHRFVSVDRCPLWVQYI